MNTKSIVITGTHITPALELINQLRSDTKTKWLIHYVGRQYTSPIDKIPAVEYELIPGLVDKYHVIDCGKLDRRYLPNTILGLPKTLKGVIQSILLIKKIAPDICISFGGYLSVPVIFASWIFKIPSITHEQTQTISLSTRINSLFVKKVALSFDTGSNGYLPVSKTTVTGNLLRQQIFSTNSQIFPKIFCNQELPLIYITAGNQGSHIINQTIAQLLPELTLSYNIVHQTGKLEFDDYKLLSAKFDNYYVFDYIQADDIGYLFANSDLIISRSGANATQEISIFATKTILVPLPVSQQNEQLINALWLKNKYPDRVRVIENTQLNSVTLKQAIDKLAKLKIERQNPEYKSNYKIMDLIYEIS